jgi:vancomycin resistance protein YoaR
VVLAVIGVFLGLAFAGSPARIAAGVRVAGVDVGGMTTSEARHALERRAASVQNVPVVFTAAGHSWRLRPSSFGVQVDWPAAVEAARRQGDGFGPFRGFRRLGVRFFGAEIMPPSTVYASALNYELGRLAKVIDRPHREAAIQLHGLNPSVVPEVAGAELDRQAAAMLIAHALAGFARGAPIALPVKIDQPTVTAADLQPVEDQVRTVLSAPVRLALGPTRWRVPRWRLAGILVLPSGGSRTLRIGGPGADRWFARLERVVNRPPTDADFAVTSRGTIRVTPSKPGLGLSVTQSAHAILAAALKPLAPRTARLTVSTAAPHRTTAAASAMGITGVVGRYTTFYGGEPNRIHNVQLVARLIDNHLIAPGSTFSFNGTTGARTAAKGFLEAPVIINGELGTGLGGGVCQVSTTVFNAAYEAGLNITARTNHALYISHYPLGRDATVNYPDTDLKFVNDTGHWLLLRTFVGSSALEVDLYGTPQHRRVESETAPLVVTGPPPVNKTPDPTLPDGETVVDDAGVSSQSTHVRRLVYTASGKLLYDTTWYSSYRAEPELVRIGTMPKPKPKPGVTATTGTTTGGTTTAQTGTGETTTTGATTTASSTTTGGTTTAPPVKPRR